jgi:hypothetical protein
MDSKTRETIAWGLSSVIALLSLIGGWNLYHEKFAEDEDTDKAFVEMGKAVEAVRAEATANAVTTFVTIKNLQRGRLASYREVPEAELTEREKKDKTIIEYDLQNLETIEQAAGLDVPDD